ncbi:monoheme cytochrome C [Robiginitalea sp. M366]|uniref:monoheme cytochrome C n=1 Tax=Robiginitalea aestuariiviva TaxID=3036903 RepID=UPI00240DA605|nr:monoheme cytochrome C [Robiginitalea aestuariiviva]MDG1571559.1 monoheme cytochrome C [Robiginitalea aestuariiviva]
MEPQHDFHKSAKAISRMLRMIFGFFLVIASLLIYLMVDPGLTAFKAAPEVVVEPAAADAVAEEDWDKVEDGIHVRTGFVAEEGYMTVVNNCTNCHSARLVTQNRMSRESWEATIRWMQQTQNLWDLGNNEEIILNYLATNYAPQKKGRRQNLENIEWYVLEN